MIVWNFSIPNVSRKGKKKKESPLCPQTKKHFVSITKQAVLRKELMLERIIVLLLCGFPSVLSWKFASDHVVWPGR